MANAFIPNAGAVVPPGQGAPVAGPVIPQPGRQWPNLHGFRFRDFYREMGAFADLTPVIAWLRDNGLLATAMACPGCQSAMEEREFTDVAEGRKWRCLVRGCRRVINLRKGSFFEKSRLPLDKLIELIFLWCDGLTQEQIGRATDLQQEALTQWSQYLRDVCSTSLLQNPRQIGGPGSVIAIDETVIARRKPGNAQGRHVAPLWLLGGVDLHTKEFFLQVIQGPHSAANLLPMIQANLAQGSEIWTDEWRAYGGLPGIAYLHRTINHSVHFVNPNNGVHTK